MDVQKYSVSLGDIYVASFPKVDILRGKQKRQMEEAMKKELLQFLYGEKGELAYYESGAPYLPEQAHLFISLSHSYNKIALYTSNKGALGIDLQIIKSGIYEGRSYFINEIEELNFNEQLKNDVVLLSIWCIKEAMYKQLGGIKNAKNDLIVSKNDQNDWFCSYKNKVMPFHSVEIENYLLFFNASVY